MYIEVGLINLLEVQLVLVGQMQHSQEAKGWRYILSRSEIAVNVFESGSAVQLLLHLLLSLNNRNHLSPHIHLHLMVALILLI